MTLTMAIVVGTGRAGLSISETATVTHNEL